MAETTNRSSVTRLASITTAAATATVGLLELARVLFRNSQLFCPERDPLLTWNPADYGLDPDFIDEVYFTSDKGVRLHGWYCRAKNPIGSMVYCHGNSGNITDAAAGCRALLEGGMNVLLFDYRGYGRSKGRPTMRGVIRDAVAAAKLHEELRPRHLPSVLFGFSLGGAIAAQLAKRHRFDALVLQSTFTNLSDIARIAFPKLPLHLASMGELDTLDVVKSLKIPTAIVHGADDEVAPAWMAEKLYDACGTPHEILLVPGGLHKDLFDRAPEVIVELMCRLVNACGAPPSAEPKLVAVPVGRSPQRVA